MHETYDCPEGHWGSVYINYKPTGAMATSFASKDEDGKTIWNSPIAEAPRHHLPPSLSRKEKGYGPRDRLEGNYNLR